MEDFEVNKDGEKIMDKVEEKPEVVKPVEAKQPEVTETKEEKSYTQIRTERAAEKARADIFKELGVETLDEAKAKLQDGTKALEIATTIQSKIEHEAAARLNANKSLQLEELFKDTFDSKVLVQLTDLEAIELDADGKIVNPDEIIAKAKEDRPHFFGQRVAKADTVVTRTAKTDAADPIQSAYETGDYQKAVREHLKHIIK